MKKYFVMLLSAAIAFSSCACGGETTEKTEEKKTVKTGESVPHRTGDEILGESEIDDNVMDVIFRDSIREDSTGNWRLAMASTSEDFLSYAASYYENYFKSDDETHFFINTTLGTTASVTKLADMLCVYMYDHVEGEEHSAKKIPEGRYLGQYWNYVDIHIAVIHGIIRPEEANYTT